MCDLNSLKTELQDTSVKYFKCEMLYNLASSYELSGFFKLGLVDKYTSQIIKDIKALKKSEHLSSALITDIDTNDIYEYFKKIQWSLISRIKNYDSSFTFENDNQNRKIAIAQLITEIDNATAESKERSNGNYDIELIQLKDLKIKLEEVYNI